MAEGGSGNDIDASSVVRFIGALKDSWFGGELASDFSDDSSGGDADGVHGAGGKDEGEEAADEEADDDFGFSKGELEARHGGAQGDEVNFEFLDVGAEEDERGEASGGDGIALGDGFHGIADGVEFVGAFAD